MNDREHMVQMLARQVLSMREPDGSAPQQTAGITDAGSARVHVEIRGIAATPQPTGAAVETVALAKVDALIDAASGWTEAEFVLLAIRALDQAGLSIGDQMRVSVLAMESIMFRAIAKVQS